MASTSPRDTQRQRLYDAEDSLSSVSSKAGQRLLSGGKKVASTGSLSIEACQAYVDHILSAAWFQTRWGQKRVTVKHKVYGRATASTGWNGTVICLPPWARNEAVILHEIAHHLTPGSYASHGPEFAGVFKTLVRYTLGKEAETTLRAAFKKYRVRYNLKAVPAAGSRTVLPRTDQVAAKKSREQQRRETERREQKAQAERRERQLLSYTARQEAARVIRAQVKAGMFGPSGCKPRVHALATARTLEKGQ